MLSLFDRRCGRRSFLQIGSLALGGLALPDLLRTQALAGDRSVVRDKSVIFLFLHGGPSQTETFDPKMTAPAGVCSATGEVQTAIPSVTFGASFPKLAQMADRVSVVRSYTTGNGNHDIKPIVNPVTLNANMGSLYSRVVGPNHPRTGLPSNAALFPRAVDPDAQPANMNFGRFDATGTLGSVYAPFVPGSGGDLQSNMKLSIPMSRLDDRRGLLRDLDRLRNHVDHSGRLEGVERLREQAYTTILGNAAAALDLSREDPRTLARYDTAPLVRPENISRRWNNYNNYVDNARALGKLLLLARRLCEAGCGFVTVTTNFVWDMHADVNNATIVEGMGYMGTPLDHALTAFLEDVELRGLRDKILLVASGEMGRTPKINKKGGRDHWGRLAPLLLAGGGLQTGQVIGQSTSDAGEPQSEPMTMDRLLATIMHTLFDIGELRLSPSVPSDVMRVLTGGEPIPGLL